MNLWGRKKFRDYLEDNIDKNTSRTLKWIKILKVFETN